MVDDIFRKVKNALLGGESVEPGEGDPRPASEDPYGDPADQVAQGQVGNPRPASEDPYGDPADQVAQGQVGNPRPASEDPYGDPADNQQNT